MVRGFLACFESNPFRVTIGCRKQPFFMRHPMKINFWYNEGCGMWRWTATNECNVTHSFSHADKETAMYKLMDTMTVLTDTCQIEEAQ